MRKKEVKNASFASLDGIVIDTSQKKSYSSGKSAEGGVKVITERKEVKPSSFPSHKIETEEVKAKDAKFHFIEGIGLPTVDPNGSRTVQSKSAEGGIRVSDPIIEIPPSSFTQIEDVPVQSVDRTLARQNISQWTQLAGENKTIILNDGINDRIIIGLIES